MNNNNNKLVKKTNFELLLKLFFRKKEYFDILVYKILNFANLNFHNCVNEPKNKTYQYI